MLNITSICYGILAPISVVSELILIYAFLRIKHMRRHPEIMIFWQCCSQLILDIHWFTGISPFKSHLTASTCQFLGSFCIYFLYVSWNYNLLLSIEILLKILNPHTTGYHTRRVWYQIVSHLTSLVVFIVLMSGDNNGNSIMETCFVQDRSVYELVVVLPAIVHFPLCIGIICYTIWISYGTFYVNYLKYHMLVVIAFSIGWVPVSLVHWASYAELYEQIPFWVVLVVDS